MTSISDLSDQLRAAQLRVTAGFTLDEIAILLNDDTPGRPASRELAQTKLIEIDSQMATLARAREIIEWAMACQ